MSDSVDRVFVHALNTVNKIPRTGTTRPPPAERLKLYGLYKQSMEGDVEGIMNRPVGHGADILGERSKWDAWYSQRGLSRSEAKRQYITTLIDTMHRYASQTSEARELVSELEFVWDQIKSNFSASVPSSPTQNIHTHLAPQPHSQTDYSQSDHSREDVVTDSRKNSLLTVLNPVKDDLPSYREEDDEDEEYREAQPEFSNENDGNDHNISNEGYTRDHRKGRDVTRGSSPHDRRWKRRVEQALTKMNAEMAAIREQMESRVLQNRCRPTTLWSWLRWLLWVLIRQILWDITILGLLWVWVRLKEGRTLDGKMKASLIWLRSRLMRMRLLSRLPLFPLLL